MRTTFLLILFFSFSMAHGQNFEGKIVYQVKYKSKTLALSEDQLIGMLGTKQEYYVKGGSYKTVVLSDALVQWQLFIPKDGKLYNKYSNSETVLWNSARENKDSVLSFTINKGVVDVVGVKCDELILNCKSGVQKYYFNEKFRLDPKLYEQHLYGNWYDYVSRSGAVPLKYIIETPQFIMETTAIEAVATKLDDNVFVLPANSTFAKSPY